MEKTSKARLRWRTLRSEVGAELSLEPHVVANSRKSDVETIYEKIIGTLTQLSNWRIENEDGFQNEDWGPGPLVKCEGLETYLVPAVEGIVSFSDFLLNYNNKSFLCDKLLEDIKSLIDAWKKINSRVSPTSIHPL